jgi:hypothetical protein
MHKTRLIWILLLCNSCLWSLLSCTASAPDNNRQVPGQPEVESTVALPEPLSLLDREASDSSGYILGSNVSMDLPNSQVPGSDGTLSFVPYLEGPLVLSRCAYGVFRVPLHESGPLRWTPTWSGAPPAGMSYFAIANFTSNRWEWQRLDEPEAAVVFSDSTPYISPQNTALIVLLVGPGAGKPQLDHFRLETTPGSGWRFVELLSELIPDDIVATTGPLSASVVNGKPALLYSLKDALGMYTSYLAVSSTALGLDSADWTTHTLQESAPQPFATQVVDIAGGYGLLGMERVAEPYSASLHYHYSTDPGAGFSDETVEDSYDITGARLAEINGLPGIGYGRIDAMGNGGFPVYYAGSDSVSGNSWTVTKLGTALITNALSDGMPAPVEFDGKPLLGFYDLLTSNGFTVASASQSIPDADNDWTLLKLGGGSNHRSFQTIFNGHALFATCETFEFPPDEIGLWTYELTGLDPSNPLDWQRTDYDGLGLGQTPIAALLGIGSELAFLHNNYEGSNLLDGSLFPVKLWHSASPGNTPGDWQRDTVVEDQQTGIGPMILVDGQPAFAQFFRLEEGYASDERTYTKLIWSIYVP